MGPPAPWPRPLGLRHFSIAVFFTAATHGRTAGGAGGFQHAQGEDGNHIELHLHDNALFFSPREAERRGDLRAEASRPAHVVDKTCNKRFVLDEASDRHECGSECGFMAEMMTAGAEQKPCSDAKIYKGDRVVTLDGKIFEEEYSDWTLLPGAIATVIDVDLLDDRFKLQNPKGDNSSWVEPKYFRFAQVYCNFKCVKEDDCGKEGTNEKATIAEKDGMFCRPCAVFGCKECDNSVPGQEACKVCGDSYYPVGDGQCNSKYGRQWTVISFVLGCLFVFILAWYLSLRCKPIVNHEGLEQGLAYRTSTLLQDPLTRAPYPLMTNLLKNGLAGPGLCLFFSFQVYVIIWAMSLAGLWYYIVSMTDDSIDLLNFGVASFRQPYEFCTSLKQDAGEYLMRKQEIFLFSAYVLTFALSIFYAAAQRRHNNKLDDATTMKDFAAIVTNLPCLDGTQDVEGMLADYFTTATEQRVIGVSVAWNCTWHYDDLIKALDPIDPVTRQTFVFQEERAATSQVIAQGSSASVLTSGDTGGTLEEQGHVSLWARLWNFVGKKTSCIDVVLSTIGILPNVNERGKTLSSDKIIDLLNKMTTSPVAFIVFETEASKHFAVEAMKHTDVQFKYKSQERLGFGGKDRTCMLTLEPTDTEPESVNWWSFGVGRMQQTLRIALGCIFIILAIIAWTICFWIPYQWYVSSYVFLPTTSPPWQSKLMLTALVIIGNQIMYFLCYLISKHVGFKYEDSREVAYILMYQTAVVLNVVGDLICAGVVAWYAMTHSTFLAEEGFIQKTTETQQTWSQIFGSFPARKALGETLYPYAFPACFLLPYMGEAVGAWGAPWHLAKLLVRSKPELQGRFAEEALAFFAPMTLARYADIHLNVFLACLSLFFVCGFWGKTFVALAACHVFILIYDHFRVLRGVPKFKYATDKVDRMSQAQMAFPCAMILTSFVERIWGSKSWAQLSQYTKGAAAGDQALLWACAAVFTIHMLVHWSILLFILPCLPQPKNVYSRTRYKELAEITPCCWFSVNPVQCLRSKFIKKDCPPCSFWICGKEERMKANPEIGTFFGSSESLREVARPQGASARTSTAGPIELGVVSKN